MTSKYIQTPAAVIMIRPHRFHPNPETASDNAFQWTDGKLSVKAIAKAAYDEVTAAAARLEQEEYEFTFLKITEKKSYISPSFIVEGEL